MKHDEESILRYVQLFEELFKSGTKVIKYILWVSVSFMVCFQICIHIPQLQGYLSYVYKTNGIPVEERNVKDW